MKYTKKLQYGGLVMYQPTPSAPPAMPTAPSGAVSASASKQSTSILDDDLKKELLSKGGLVNETNALIQEIIKLESQSDNPFLNQSTRSNTLEIIAKINELRQNKNMWEQSFDLSKSSGGLSEIAVGNKGELYVRGEQGLQAMSVSDYKKNAGKVRALSVAELLEERNSNPGLVGNNSIFNIANNSIGIEKISDYASKIVNALGKEVRKSQEIYDRSELQGRLQALGTEVQSTGRTPSQEELKGFEILETLKNSPSRYNEIISESSTQKNHALKAVKYIWTTLGQNAQNKLSAQAAINGVSPSEMLLDLVIIGANESTSTQVNPISESKARSGSESGSESLTGAKNMTPVELLMDGTFNTGNQFTFNDPETNSKFQGMMTGSMALTSIDGKPIGPTTLFGVLKEGWEQLVNTENMYFGNRKIESRHLNEIIIDGMSDIARVLLPVDNSGKPDNASLQEYQELMKYYNSNKEGMSKAEVQKLFNNSGFEVTVNEDKSLNVSKMGANVQPFLIAYAYTNEGSDLPEENSDVNSGGLRALKGVEKDNMKSFEDAAWTRGSGKSRVDFKPSEGFFGRLFGTERYKGVVYMSIREGGDVLAGATQGAGPKKPVYSVSDTMYNAQNSSRNSYVKSDISLLQNE